MTSYSTALNRRKEGSIALLLIGLFIGLSLATVGRFSPWLDESYSATLIESSYSDIIRRTALDVHPPLYYLLLKTWSEAFGSSVVALRLFSLFCMTNAIVIAWRMFRRWYGRQRGLLALAGMSVGPFLIRYSQETRMYGLGALLAMSATYVFWQLFYSTDDLGKKVRLYVAAYVLLITAAIYTHYFLLFVTVTHLLFLLFNRTRRVPAQWAICFGLPVLLFIPWLPIALEQFRRSTGTSWIPKFMVESVTSSFVNLLLFRRQYQLSGWSALLAIVILVSVIVVVVSWYGAGSEEPSEQFLAKRLSAYLLVIPLLLLIVVSLPPFHPAYQDRYLSFYAPILYGSLALCIAHWVSRHKGLVARAPVIVIVGALVAGVVFASVEGNSAGWGRRHFFGMNKIAGFIRQNDPHSQVVSTSLLTFLDAHIVIGKSMTARLYTPNGIDTYGSASLVFDRPDLLIKDLSGLKGPHVWLIEESDLQPVKVPSNWYELTHFHRGYARAILFAIKN